MARKHISQVSNLGQSKTVWRAWAALPFLQSFQREPVYAETSSASDMDCGFQSASRDISVKGMEDPNDDPALQINRDPQKYRKYGLAYSPVSECMAIFKSIYRRNILYAMLCLGSLYKTWFIVNMQIIALFIFRI